MELTDHAFCELRPRAGARRAALPGIAWDHCGGSDTISIFNPSIPSITASFVVDRRNAMSYFKECWLSGHDMSIVPQQIGKVKAMLSGPFRTHLFP